MKTISAFAIGLCLCYQAFVGDAFMNIEEFRKNIVPLCYGRKYSGEEKPNGQLLPIPNSIESFVSLVEKIEDIYPKWRPEDIIKALLLNFRYDDAEYLTGSSFKTRGSAGVSKSYEIMNELFNKPTSTSDFKPEDLTQDERCSLYYMISHTVNDTARSNEEEKVNINGQEYIKNLREQGVVSLSSQTVHAIALGKVLLGLLAGFRSEKSELNAQQLFKRLLPDTAVPPESLIDINVNILYGATFGDVISVSKEIQTQQKGNWEKQPFMPNGVWNEKICPTYYIIDDITDERRRNYHVTQSSIRGAVDGYVLGSWVQRTPNKDLRLSQILRMYYSQDGIPDSQEMTYCNRRAIFNNNDGWKNLQIQAINYDKVFTAYTGVIEEDSSQVDAVNRVLDGLKSSEQDTFDAVTRESTDCSISTAARVCETSSDIIAVLDWKPSEQQRIIQAEILGNLSVGYQLGTYGSSVSVYTNLKPNGKLEWDVLVDRSQVSGCAGCAAYYYDPQRTSTESEVEVLRDLNRTIGELIEDTADENGVPAKVILYFNYGNPPDDYQLREVVKDIERSRATVFAIGSNKDRLLIFGSSDNVEIMTTSSLDSINKLKEKICKVPAEFQYKNCQKKSENNDNYEGFVTSNHIQYWAMYPKYFLKSGHIDLTFKAVSGQIRVCYTRNYDDLIQNKGDCKESSTNSGDIIEFYLSNPCKRRTEYNCPALFFSVEGKMPKTDIFCTEKRCKRPDQIQFEFSHKGIACNGSGDLSGLTASVFLVIAGSLLRFFSA